MPNPLPTNAGALKEYARRKSKYHSDPEYRQKMIDRASAQKRKERTKAARKKYQEQARIRKRWISGLDPLWASWLSGFVAGEGCFSSHGITPTFHLGIRDDDQAVLHEAAQKVGGYVSFNAAKRQARWHVSKAEDQLKLALLLERYPVRNRKGREVQLWTYMVRRKKKERLVSGRVNGVDRNWFYRCAARLSDMKKYPLPA